MAAYWMTWKPFDGATPKGWPTERMQDLVERFRAAPSTVQPWRIAANRAVQVGDRAYFFKQGKGARGVFGVGEVVGPPYLIPEELKDPNAPQFFALIRFRALVDPTEAMLLPLAAIDGVVPKTLVNIQASGTGVPDDVASRLDALLASAEPTPVDPDGGGPGADWTAAQVAAAVDAYFRRLRLEVDGVPYSKADHNERVRMATGRSKGSAEFKLQNISAVLYGMGLRWIDGYKPRGHGQVGAISEAVDAHLGRHQGFADRLEAARDAPPAVPVGPGAAFADPPPRSEAKPAPNAPNGAAVPLRCDRAASDARNRALGEQGERYVVEVERRRLAEAGRADLASLVAWTAKDEGDGAGYDVASSEADGSPRLIEVKTTNGGADTPFYATANEVRVSRSAHPATGSTGSTGSARNRASTCSGVPSTAIASR